MLCRFKLPFGSHGGVHLLSLQQSPCPLLDERKEVICSVEASCCRIPWCGRARLKYATYAISHALKLLLGKNQQMVKAFLADTPQEAFADRMGSWCMNGRFEHLDGTRCRHPSKTGSQFALMITHQLLRCLPIRGGFPQVLRDPGIGGRSCHSDVDHLP
jgi:hypothetical protein